MTERDLRTVLAEYFVSGASLSLRSTGTDTIDFTHFALVRYDQVAYPNDQQLRSVRIGAQDRKIASVALASQLILVTANRRDFARVPGLVFEDWSG